MSSSTEGDGVHGEASPLTATHGRSVSFSLCEGGAAARGGSVRAPSLAGHGARRHDAILGTAFNQDASCFAVWHESGFAVFAAEPFKEILRRGTLLPGARERPALVTDALPRVWRRRHWPCGAVQQEQPAGDCGRGAESKVLVEQGHPPR